MKKTFINLVKAGIKKAATQYKVAPYNVTTTQFWSVADKSITEWEVRKLGGVTGLRDSLFPSEKASTTQPRSKKKFKPVSPKLENFTVHDVDIKKLFKEAKLGKDDVLRVVVQPDTHVPEEDKPAISVFCKFLEYYKPHGLINLGDFLEMGPVSHWDSRDASPRRFVPEAKQARALLKRIGESAGPQCIFKRFIMGNHEDWWNQYLSAKIPEVLDGIEELGTSLKLEDVIGLKDFGYRTIPLNEILRLGNAHFIHGYYTGQMHSKKHLDVFGVNLYYGHLHDVQSYSGVSVNGLHEAMSLGCLRTLHAPFLKGKPNNWSHSFGVFEFRYDGSYTRYVPIIVDGVMSFNGKVFKA